MFYNLKKNDFACIHLKIPPSPGLAEGYICGFEKKFQIGNKYFFYCHKIQLDFVIAGLKNGPASLSCPPVSSAKRSVTGIPGVKT